MAENGFKAKEIVKQTRAGTSCGICSFHVKKIAEMSNAKKIKVVFEEKEYLISQNDWESIEKVSSGLQSHAQVFALSLDKDTFCRILVVQENAKLFSLA
jgi:NAD(P)H-nitrite reductase large subunit